MNIDLTGTWNKVYHLRCNPVTGTGSRLGFR